MTVAKPISTSRKIPSVRELKDEVEGKRDHAKANGKTLKNNVAMKEVARKYGCRTWEELHALALNGAAAPADAPTGVSVVLLRIDQFAQVLILNRSIIARNNAYDGLAEEIAQALGVKVKFVDYKSETGDTPEWAFSGVAAKLGLTGETRDGDSAALEPEGKTFAEKLANFFGTENSWGEHPNYPRSDWRYEVEHDNTGAAYWDYVASEIESNDDFAPWESEFVIAQTVIDELGWDVRKCPSSATAGDVAWCVFVGGEQTPLCGSSDTQEGATLMAYRDIISKVSAHRRTSIEQSKKMTFRRQVEIIEDYLCEH
jgi:hypothetical protein